MDKKWTQSATIVGMLLAMVMQTLLGFEVIPADAADPGNAIANGVVEMIRNVGLLVSTIGVRRALSKDPT